MSVVFPPRRLSGAIVRQLRLSRGSRVLHVGCGRGEVVSLLRRAGREAYGLFDGPAQERLEESDVPQIQPARLHQSLPFLAQSFDGVVVQQADDYDGLLSTPESCTATANLLAALKPGGTLIYCGTTDFADMKRHLGQFPGKGSQMTLGSGGLLRLVLRMLGLSRPGLPALKFTIPHEAISRLEWHRIARQAVANLNRPVEDVGEQTSDAAAESPAA